MFDYIFKNGLVVDGTGKPAYKADLAVSGDSIMDIAPELSPQKAKKVIDISGHCLSPGFIDLHTHSDFPLLLDGRALSAVYQGITTQVIGNCGFGPAPLRAPENIKRNVFCFRDPYTPVWNSFTGFLEHLEGISFGTNVAALVGHAALRSWGAGYENRPLSKEEITKISVQLNDAMEAGAFGLSSGLEYSPGINANQNELGSLCSIVASHSGLYATHVRNRDEDYQKGFREAFETARQSKVRIQISHCVPKYGAPIDAADWFLNELHSVSKSIDAAGDAIPYEWGPTSLSAILPNELMANTSNEIAEMLKSKNVRKKIINQEKHFWLQFRDEAWDKILLYHSKKFPELEGKSGYEIGEYFHSDPFNGFLSILQEEGDSMFSVLMMGKIKSREHLDEIIKDPLVGVISDGMSLATDGPLSDFIWSPGCYGWVPRFLNRYTGEGKMLSLEAGIQKITEFPAKRLGLKDRGVIKKGAKADINVFKPGTLEENASIQKPGVYTSGFRYVMCNGVFSISNETFTGKLPGKIIRNN